MNLRSMTASCVHVRIAVALTGCIIALASAAGLALAASPDEAPPIPSGQARIWFLRQLIPGTAMHAPMIYANGQSVAIVPQGVTFYRDLTPGTYSFAIQSCLPAEQTSVTLPFGPGNVIALQVLASDYGGWNCESGENMYLALAPADQLGMLFAPLSYLGEK